MILRPYQERAVAAVYDHLRARDDHPCVVIPTGAGKTLVLAQICRDAVSKWGGRVLVLAHVKELLAQAEDKILRNAPELQDRVGVYSAGLGRRDTEHAIVIAGIQSVHDKACELGRFDLVLVDEAHLIPPSGEGRYLRFLKDARVVNPNLRIVGLTATPYRMKSGLICGPENVLNHVCYEAEIPELIGLDFLSPVTTRGTRHAVDTSGLHVRGGEFVQAEVEALMDGDELVRTVSEEIVEATQDRKSVLVFGSSVAHAKHLAETIESISGEKAHTVFGATPSSERSEILEGFCRKRFKYLVNRDVLTTGFDAPGIDCVALVRPTLSPGLYYQMVGRGFRVEEGKDDCLVLDFGGNVLRHGPVDELSPRSRQTRRRPGEAPAKQCPECLCLMATGFAVCPMCGHVFPPPERKNVEPTPSTAGILSAEVEDEVLEVSGVRYFVHTKKGAEPGAPKTLRVEYCTGFHQYTSEWICLEHGGWARTRARDWWTRRSFAPCPSSAREAEVLARAGALAPTHTITVRRKPGERYSAVVRHELGPKPQWREPEWDDGSGALVSNLEEMAELPF